MDASAYREHLFAYQARCVDRMRAMETSLCAHAGDVSVETRIGILTDPPGAGKTRVVVGLIAGDGDPPAFPPPIYTDLVIPPLVRVNCVRQTQSEAPCANTTVVVVSQSLVAQWESELTRSSACRDSMLVVRVNKDVERLARMIRAPENNPLVASETPRVILVAVRRYVDVVMHLTESAVRVRRVVVDEAMHMHDASTSRMPMTAFTWLVSAASEGATCREVIPSRSRAFWCALTMLPLHTFRMLVVRTPDADIVYPGTVDTRYYTCDLDGYMAVAAQSLVTSQVRTLLEANDVQAAIAAMGGSAEEDLMTVVKRRIQNDLQITILERSRLELIDARRYAPQIARLTEREARLLRDAQNAEERFSTALAADCLICHDTIATPVLVTCCQTLYCAECLLTWTYAARVGTRNCPACRSDEYRIERIAVPGAAAAPPVARTRVPTKTDVVLEIVAAARGGVMLYSSNLVGLRRAIHALRAAGHKTEEVKGQSRTRDKRLRDFASGSTKVLALDATLNCAGIDLQALSDIIIYHDMPETIKDQIVGRGHRVNRAAALTVHCLWQRAP